MKDKVTELQSYVGNLQKLKDSSEAIMKAGGYNPKGKNADSLIKQITGFNKNFETMLQSLDAVFGS